MARKGDKLAFPRRFAFIYSIVRGWRGMYKIDYEIRLKNNAPIKGTAEVAHGEWRLTPVLAQDEIVSAVARIPLEMVEDERVFINGYQTWTACPERKKWDKIKGVGHFPGFIKKHYGMERYGDYFFVDYPEKNGVIHGESWCYFRRGEAYRLIASLDERAGYTLLQYDAAAQCLTVTRDCAGIECGGEYPVFELFFAEGTEDEVFDAWFAAMGITPRTDKRLAGYTSWYNRYQNISAATITEDLDGCAGMLSAGDLFQIDDGWEPYVGDWLETDEKKFPQGLAPLVEKIHERGYLAGLWLAPFACQKGSKIMREHPDWLLKRDGKPWYCGCNWGGFYALDIDNEEFVAYLERVFDRVLNEWGFDLVKLDFLYAAAPYGDAHETRAGRMTRGMELLRRLCGDKLILGCGVPVMPAFGLVDYCRISCDVGLDWNNNFIVRSANRETVSTRNAILNTVFRRQLNGRAYLNDPDVFFLREDNIKLTPEEKHALATVNSLFGGVLLHSDNMGKYSPAAKEAYAQLIKNRDAANIRVMNDADVLTVSYELDGVTHTLEIK